MQAKEDLIKMSEDSCTEEERQNEEDNEVSRPSPSSDSVSITIVDTMKPPEQNPETPDSSSFFFDVGSALSISCSPTTSFTSLATSFTSTKPAISSATESSSFRSA